MKFGQLLILIFLIGCSSQESYDSVQIESNVDTTLARIGDVVNYNVISHFSKDRIVQFPDMPETESMEIRSKNVFVKNNNPINVIFEIVFWDTGTFYIPEYPVNFLKADSTLDFSIKSDSIKINVLSMVAGAENKSLRPLKDPVALKEPLNWYRIILLIILLFLILILLGLWRKRLKKPDLKKISVSASKSARDIAIARLGDFENTIKMDSKTFYLHASFIIREFIENQFYVRALEMTTNELRTFENEIVLDKKDFKSIINILNRADLAKFAKYEFSISDRKSDYDWIAEFLRNK